MSYLAAFASVFFISVYVKVCSAVACVEGTLAGASILEGWGVRDPQIFGRGSWTGREILLYLIMHRKYVRKW